METNNLGMRDLDGRNSFTSQDSNHPVTASDDTVFPASDFYDETGKYRSEDFEDLGSLHYMNYLHSHDDML